MEKKFCQLRISKGSKEIDFTFLLLPSPTPPHANSDRKNPSYGTCGSESGLTLPLTEIGNSNLIAGVLEREGFCCKLSPLQLPKGITSFQQGKSFFFHFDYQN